MVLDKESSQRNICHTRWVESPFGLKNVPVSLWKLPSGLLNEAGTFVTYQWMSLDYPMFASF